MVLFIHVVVNVKHIKENPLENNNPLNALTQKLQKDKNVSIHLFYISSWEEFRLLRTYHNSMAFIIKSKKIEFKNIRFWWKIHKKYFILLLRYSIIISPPRFWRVTKNAVFNMKHRHMYFSAVYCKLLCKKNSFEYNF